MKRTIHTVLSTLAAGALLAMSASGSAAGTDYDASRWSGDLRYSVYHIAAEYAAAKAAGTLNSGQAGPSGPQSLTKGRIEASHASDLRFSIYDANDRAYW